jgi:hypothetical protein
MNNYLIKLTLFSLLITNLSYAQNVELCWWCPLNNCNYCFGHSAGGGNAGGNDDTIDHGNGGSGGSSSTCSMSIPLTSHLPGGVTAFVSAGGENCGAHVVYDSGDFASICYIANSSTTCWRSYTHPSGGTYFFGISHQEACAFTGFQTLYQHFYDSFYFEC